MTRRGHPVLESPRLWICRDRRRSLVSRHPCLRQRILFFTLLAIVVPTTLIAFGLVIYGMRGEPNRG